jgi:hypothetical protein
LKGLEERYGARFAPPALLKKHVDAGTKFFPEEK